MTYDKKSKSFGKPVSKEEVLAELGHPSTWSRDTRKLEIEHRLHKGQKELDIAGIRGCGRLTGYLDYLRKELVHPLGANTGLVTEEVNAEILRNTQKEITAEIQKYEARLVELEKSPYAVSRFLYEARDWLKKVETNPLFAEQDPMAQPIEELQELTRESNKKRILEIAQLRADIEKYTALLATLQ